MSDDKVLVQVKYPFGPPEDEQDVSQLPTEEMYRELMEEAGWTEDPRDGKAILTEQGYEVLNPVPVSPPMPVEPYEDVMSIIQRTVANYVAGLSEGDEIDTEEEANDFDVVEEWDPSSMYEIRDVIEEAPRLPKPDPVETPSAGGASPPAAEAPTA